MIFFVLSISSWRLLFLFDKEKNAIINIPHLFSTIQLGEINNYCFEPKQKSLRCVFKMYWASLFHATSGRPERILEKQFFNGFEVYK